MIRGNSGRFAYFNDLCPNVCMTSVSIYKLYHNKLPPLCDHTLIIIDKTLKTIETPYALRPHDTSSGVPRVSHANAEAGLVYKL